MGGGQSNAAGSKTITQHDRAVADLKSQMAKLDRYQKQLGIKGKEEETAIKKLLAAGRRDKAMYLLKLKKIREANAKNCQATYMKLEELVLGIENAQMNQDVLKALQVGNESLKKLNSIMSIEAVEALLDETQDAIEEQREIDALLMGNLTPQFEEELEDELKELIAESEPAKAPVFVAPTKTVEKDPLAELEGMAAPTHTVEPVSDPASTYEKDLADLEELDSLNAPTHAVTVESREVELAD